jgi:hypothetical protein
VEPWNAVVVSVSQLSRSDLIRVEHDCFPLARALHRTENAVVITRERALYPRAWIIYRPLSLEPSPDGECLESCIPRTTKTGKRLLPFSLLLFRQILTLSSRNDIKVSTATTNQLQTLGSIMLFAIGSINTALPWPWRKHERMPKDELPECY